MTSPAPKWILVARVLGARGNKGEVAAELLTDFPQRLTQCKELFLGPARGGSEPHPVQLLNAWLSQNHKGQAVFHFAGVQTISEAEKFKGLELFLPLEQRVALPAGQYFISDLIGCSVFELSLSRSLVSSAPCAMAEAPELLGTVRDVQFPGAELRGTPILEIETARGELLIPLALDICRKIDPPARRIEVVLPEGLRELNH